MSVKKRSISFDSADGHTKVAAYLYTDAARPPRAVVQLSHGMCEYIGRYDDFAAYLCAQGYAVCGNDHLGHGATADGGTVGYFADHGGAALVLEDLHSMNRIAHEQFPGLPVVLFGHSMGSFFARWYAARWPDTIDGLVICGTGGPNPLGGIGLALTRFLARRKGPKYRSKLINELAFGNYLRKIPNAKTPYDWISRDEEIVQAYAADRKCTFVFTVSAFHDLMTALKQVSSQRWADALPKQLPVLVISGEMDPVGDYGKGVRTVHHWLQQAGVKDLSMTLYPGARHELINETCRGTVYEDLRRWLDARYPECGSEEKS